MSRPLLRYEQDSFDTYIYLSPACLRRVSLRVDFIRMQPGSAYWYTAFPRKTLDATSGLQARVLKSALDCAFT